jgi:predicted ATPase
LLDIYEKEGRRRVLTEWIRALTPMDVQDFEFPPDQVGRVLVTLVEAQEHEISAYSASDGTLRFLAIAAALLGSEAARFYFFEELENGIHPTRLHLLLDLIEQNVTRRDNQVIATTHSPQLLRLVSPQTLEYTSLVYRIESELDGHIRRLIDLPGPARKTLERRDLARLYESGWFEDVISFLIEEADSRSPVKV